MNELNQLTEHHEFIVSTDRKSLYTQIKYLVQQAQEVASKELNQRRNILKSLLEYEDKIYEEEFASKVKSRIDEDIRNRKDNLLKIKEASTKNELEFLKSKRIQQYMNSCYEIREALKRKETQNVKECQLEQMLDKERAVRKGQDLENYWQKVQNINLQLMDERQQQENCLKKDIAKRVTDTRKLQLQDLQEKREKERQQKLEEIITLKAVTEELRLEEFDRKLQKKPNTVADYHKELAEMIKEKNEMQSKEKQKETEMHRKMMSEIAQIEAEENAKTQQKKRDFYKTTKNFIQFTEGIRHIEKEQERLAEQRSNDLRNMDMYTKGNILLERQRKARIAEQCYTQLRQQMCEQYEARLREKTEYGENKLLENRFVHKEISREEIVQGKQKYRQELDKQIEEIKKIRAAEDEKFSNDLKQASNDAVFCNGLAEKYIGDGIDYLKPHPNWHILACSSDKYVAKSFPS